MKITTIKTEQRALVAILQLGTRKDERRKLRNYLLSEARVEVFGTEEGIEIRKRMDVLLQHGRSLGDVATFREDPTLSDEAKEFLNVSSKYRSKAARVTKQQVEHIVGLLKDYQKSRALYQSAQKITELCTGQFTDTTFAEAEKAFFEGVKAIREDRKKTLTHIGRMRTEADALHWFKNIMRPRKNRFISTGLPALDRHMKGFQRGDMVVVSAPRGGGKTALLLQAAINQFKAGYNVGIASLEMQEELLWERVIANVTDTDFWKIRLREIEKKEEIRKLWRRWKRFEIETTKKYNNFFTPWDIKDPEYMPQHIELDFGPFGYDVIYVDYISLFGTGKKDMWLAQKDHGRYLKALAGRLNCVIVVLTQLSKEERVKYGTGPEEDCDYWLKWRYGDEEEKTNEVEIVMDKARHAKKCVIKAEFRLSKMQIITRGTAPLAGVGSMSKWSARKKGKQQSDVKETPDWNDLEDVDDIEQYRDEPEPATPRRRRKKRRPKEAATQSLDDAVEAELASL